MSGSRYKVATRLSPTRWAEVAGANFTAVLDTYGALKTADVRTMLGAAAAQDLAVIARACKPGSKNPDFLWPGCLEVLAMGRGVIQTPLGIYFISDYSGKIY
jgi:hypothetical protein